eukprot:353636-Chlamydomonas_euryale.AAC.3
MTPEEAYLESLWAEPKGVEDRAVLSDSQVCSGAALRALGRVRTSSDVVHVYATTGHPKRKCTPDVRGKCWQPQGYIYDPPRRLVQPRQAFDGPVATESATKPATTARQRRRENRQKAHRI